MHTPDGFITSWICVVMLIVSAGAMLVAGWKRKEWLTRDKVPKMALVAGAIFLLQMLNFPVANGTSGHFLGAALATVLLGPYAAIVAVATVVATQAFVFGDGGALALGINTFNMAVVGVAAAHLAQKFLRNKASESVSLLASSWLSVVAASVSASFFLAASGHAAPLAIFTSMIAVHAIIGLGEGIIGLGAMRLLYAKSDSRTEFTFARSAAYLALALLVAGLALPFASAEPDGMQKVSINMGFYSAATTVYDAPVAGYLVAGLPSSLAGVAAAAMGAALCFALVSAIGTALAAKPVAQRA